MTIQNLNSSWDKGKISYGNIEYDVDWMSEQSPSVSKNNSLREQKARDSQEKMHSDADMDQTKKTSKGKTQNVQGSATDQIQSYESYIHQTMQTQTFQLDTEETLNSTS